MFARNRAIFLWIGLVLLLPIGASISSAQQVCKQQTKVQATNTCQQPQAPPAETRQKPTPTYTPKDTVPRDFPAANEEEAKRAQEAAKVLAEMTTMKESGIPNSLLRDAKGIAVIPSVKKAALGIGGRWGRGLMSTRNDEGAWVPPSYIEITGGSVGFQIGVESNDLVLVFRDKDAVKNLMKGKLKLGADAAVAAGPVGRKGEAGIDILMTSPILAYTRSRGLFAGVALDGSVISIDDTANQKVYGKYVHGDEILLYSRVAMNQTVQPFVDALNKYTSEEVKATSVPATSNTNMCSSNCSSK